MQLSLQCYGSLGAAQGEFGAAVPGCKACGIAVFFGMLDVTLCGLWRTPALYTLLTPPFSRRRSAIKSTLRLWPDAENTMRHTSTQSFPTELYKPFYFRPSKIMEIIREVLPSWKMMKWRLREGVEFFKFLRAH